MGQCVAHPREGKDAKRPLKEGKYASSGNFTGRRWMKQTEDRNCGVRIRCPSCLPRRPLKRQPRRKNAEVDDLQDDMGLLKKRKCNHPSKEYMQGTGATVSEIKLHHTTGSVHDLRIKSEESNAHWVDFNAISEQWTIGIYLPSITEKVEILVWDTDTVYSIKQILKEMGYSEYPLFIRRGREVYELQDRLKLRECQGLHNLSQLIARNIQKDNISTREDPRKKRKHELPPVAAMEPATPCSPCSPMAPFSPKLKADEFIPIVNAEILTRQSTLTAV
ncbi:hypothetical protein AAMO2058_001423500 [Amorphochlora amoebiformis]|mmetsp:Transcript_22968/g.36083  ORF Transcript_22968/g.36083 Transcript_22968/m.36083 type:complete len:277 (-) Transcript_22968:133-963(-)